MAQGRSGSGSSNQGRGGSGRGFGKSKDFRGGKPSAGGRGAAGFGSKSGKPGSKSGAGKGFGSKSGKPGAKGSAGKGGASRGFRSGPAFASERGEYRPSSNFKRNDNYAGPHRPRRPKNAPVDHYEFYDHDGVRLQKLMAQAGVASRRVCEQMIEEGRVTVNGELVTELGVRVNPDKVEVHVDGLRIQTNEKLVYMAFNKPAGVVSSMEDPDGRPDISHFLRKSMSQRVFHVGRLDVETEGLLLLTNDGELANRLTHPSYEVPKTYLVQVPGPMDQGIGAAMKKGIRLEDGVSRVDTFKLIDSTPGHILVEVTIHSGKNRIVRRLFEAVGHPVEKLVRVQMGPVRIGSQKQGTIRNLSKVEIGELLASVGM